MGLIERLNELESMRQSGQISDSEYAMLVAGATKKFSEIPESLKSDTSESVSEIPQTHSQSKTSSANPKLFGIGLITVLIIAFLVFGRGGSGDKPSASSTDLNSAPSNIAASTTLPPWKVQQLAEEKEEREREKYWSANYKTFFDAVEMGKAKSGSRDDLITALARDLAEAKGAVTQFRASEYEVIRLVVADFVNEAVIAYEELLGAFSAYDKVKGAKAFAQLEYLNKQLRKISRCVYGNNLNC